MIRALVVGGASGVWKELEIATDMATFDHLIFVNHAARDFPGKFGHWVSMHAELMPKWIAERRKHKRPDPDHYWTAERRMVHEPIPNLQRAENWGGSSGLLAVTVALTKLDADRVLVIGCPMEANQGHYDDERPWKDAHNYCRAWERHVDKMKDRVRSMGGWTSRLLGRPTQEWLGVEEVGAKAPGVGGPAQA